MPHWYQSSEAEVSASDADALNVVVVPMLTVAGPEIATAGGYWQEGLNLRR